MPRKPKTPPVELPAIPAELLEQFGNGPMTAESINADLHSGERRSRSGRTRRVCRRAVGATIPDGQRRVAQCLGSLHSLLRLPTSGAQGHLHNKFH